MFYRNPIVLFRVLLLLGAMGIGVIGSFSNVKPLLIEWRIFLCTIYVLIFIGSFFVDWIKKYFHEINLTCFLLVMAYALSGVYISQLSTHYTTGLYILFLAGTASFFKKKYFYIFFILNVISTVVVALMIAEPQNDKIVFLARFSAVSTITFIFGTTITSYSSKLKESASNFTTLLNNVNEAYFLFDKNYNILQFNAVAAYNIKTYFKIDLKIGLHYSKISTGENFEQFRIHHAEAWSGKNVNLEREIALATGGRRWAEIKYAPVKNSEGEVIAVLNSMLDIDDKKRAEAALELSENRFRGLYENAPIGIALSNTNGGLLEVNNSFCEILEYSADELRKLSFYELTHPDDREENLINLKKLLKEGKRVFELKKRYITKSGKTIQALLRVGVIEDNPDGGKLIVSQLVDITKLKNFEAELIEKNKSLEKINKELDQFVYSASHDLKAPLTSIRGLISLAQATKSATDIDEYLAMMDQSSVRLLSFIDDLINFSKNQKTELENQEINIVELLNEIWVNLRYNDNADKIDFSIETIDDHLFINTDKNRLKVILSNLIANAIHYHDMQKEHPWLKVKYKRNNDKTEITVQDNGLGIAQSEQKNIFGLFYRAHEYSKGSGLGLYIVQENVNKMGGEIKLDSEVDKGSLFTIALP